MKNLRISVSLALIIAMTPLIAAPQTQNIAATEKSTSYKTSIKRIKEQLAQSAKLEARGTYVGELQELWQFPSDHLPISMTMGDIHIASWNVLDADYMSWVTEKDSQGLKRSMIVDEHIYIEGTSLTVRDLHVIDMILGMISHATHPKSLIALQECNKAFVKELRARLPTGYEVISHKGEAFIVDTNAYTILDAKEVLGVFSETPKRGFQEILLQSNLTGEKLLLLNSHLPGDPLDPARFEFTEYLAKTFDPSAATIAMGDMNFNEFEMEQSLLVAFAGRSPFSLHSSYCTNISPFAFTSKAIDHFLVYLPNGLQIELNTPEEVMTGLTIMVDLLEPGVAE
ncbi:MAG: hypothetical protein NTX49_08775 [Chlamydiae bacterium]|nr:hypothetical protein [Chlamydiota bacterium]